LNPRPLEPQSKVGAYRSETRLPYGGRESYELYSNAVPTECGMLLMENHFSTEHANLSVICCPTVINEPLLRPIRNRYATLCQFYPLTVPSAPLATNSRALISTT
jgi:hypothetical protein